MTFTRDFKDSDAYQWMSFGSFGTLQSGNNIIPNNRIFKDRSLESGCINYSLDTLSSRLITIDTIDFTHGLVRGRFEFTAKNLCDDTKEITGEFHLKPYWSE